MTRSCRSSEGRGPPRAAILILALLGGCGASASLPGNSDGSESSGATAATKDPSLPTSATSSDSTGTATSPETTGRPTTTSDASTTGPGEDSTGEQSTEATNFLLDPDVGSEVGCSVWDQNCPPGQKCTAYVREGENNWNATRCSPIDPNPDADREPCTVEGRVDSGVDSCDVGLMCWYFDPDTLLGECVPLCVGSQWNPVCVAPGRSCNTNPSATLALCLPICNPLAPDCRENEACYPTHEGFTCAPDASGDAGADGDPCEFLQGCDAGLSCQSASDLAGCDLGSSGCCSPYCDTMQPETCTDPLETCIRFFEVGNAPPGLQNTGFCGLES